MFSLFRRKKQTTLLKAYAYYVLYLAYRHNRFQRRGGFLFLTKWNMHYFLFLMDYKHWCETGELLFKHEARFVSLYGIQYESLNYEFIHYSLQMSLPSYAEYNSHEYNEMFEYLSSEEGEMIEVFFNENFMPLKNKRNDLDVSCLKELDVPITQKEPSSTIYLISDESMIILFEKVTNLIDE